VEGARRRLEESADRVDAVAHSCGFGTAESMRRAFLRTVRVPPGRLSEPVQIGHCCIEQSPGASMTTNRIVSIAFDPLVHRPLGRRHRRTAFRRWPRRSDVRWQRAGPARRYRAWIFVGTSLGLNYADNPAAADGGARHFKNIYIDPRAYREYVKAGTFPRDESWPWSWRARGESASPVAGTFESQFVGLEVSTKDSKRFPVAGVTSTSPVVAAHCCLGQPRIRGKPARRAHGARGDRQCVHAVLSRVECQSEVRRSKCTVTRMSASMN